MLKRRIEAGRGDFPMDAPINDTTVRLHYTVARSVAPDRHLFSTRATSPEAPPTEVTTGEGELPLGLEMAIKLMLPGERCLVTVLPALGYTTCDVDAVGDMPSDETLVFDVLLLNFDTDGHPEAMSCDQVHCLLMPRPCPPCWSSADCHGHSVQVLAYGTKLKEQANDLYRKHRVEFAVRKYDRAISVLKKCRAADTPEQAQALTVLQSSLLSNIAAAYMAQQVCPRLFFLLNTTGAHCTQSVTKGCGECRSTPKPSAAAMRRSALMTPT